MLVEQPLADHFRAFATVVERDGGTIYPAISRAVAENDEVLALLDGAPLPQRRPLLLLASVHFLLLSGVEHPLAALYDTVAAVRGTPYDPSGDAAVAFADFCHEHRGALEGLIATRTTQTNEVGRCTALLPGLCHVAAQYDRNEPLSLLDLGTSAGLNLLFDDYAYAYRAAEGDATLTAGGGTPGSPSSAPPATTSSISPSSACPPWRPASGSTSPLSTHAPTTPPCGCWPASGPTTRRASGVCAPRWPTCAPPRNPRAWSAATW